MKIQYFRYFINNTIQQSLIPADNKKKLVKSIIGKEMKFVHSGRQYRYLVHKITGNFIHAKLGKRRSVVRTMPEGHDFVPQKDEPDYLYCSIFFDCNAKTPGQKIAFQHKPSVFRSPEKTLRILENEFNKSFIVRGVIMDINAITSQEKFWQIIKENKGKIQKLTFSYNVPNLFNLKNKLSDDLKESNKQYGITKTTITLENKEGHLRLSEDDPFLTESASYTGDGGGNYSIKVMGENTKKIFHSGQNVKTKNFPKKSSDTNAPENIEEIFEDDTLNFDKTKDSTDNGEKN